MLHQDGWSHFCFTGCFLVSSFFSSLAECCNSVLLVCGRRNSPSRHSCSVLTDELESQVFVGSRLFGVFVQKHDGASDPAVLQSLLTHARQLQGGNNTVRP